jgi:hypothetical protein
MANIRKANSSIDVSCSCGKESTVIIEGDESCYYCDNRISLCEECFTKLLK